jgi:hypothetical protein
MDCRAVYLPKGDFKSDRVSGRVAIALAVALVFTVLAVEVALSRSFMSFTLSTRRPVPLRLPE